MPDGPPQHRPPPAPKPERLNAFIDEANKVGQDIAHGLGLIKRQKRPRLFVDCVIGLRDLICDNEVLLCHAFTIWIDHSPPAWEPTAPGVLEGVVKIGQRVICAAAIAARKDWKSRSLKRAITQNFAASSAFVRPILDRFDAASVKAELICSAKRLASTPNLIAPSQLRDSDLGWFRCDLEMMERLPERYVYLSSDKEREAAILKSLEKQADPKLSVPPAGGVDEDLRRELRSSPENVKGKTSTPKHKKPAKKPGNPDNQWDMAKKQQALKLRQNWKAAGGTLNEFLKAKYPSDEKRQQDARRTIETVGRNLRRNSNWPNPPSG